MKERKSALEQELEELFDARNAKTRHEKILNQESMEAQKEIRLLTHMFRDGVPDVTIPINSNEAIKWDFKLQKLLYLNGDNSYILEGTSRLIMIRLRPHLTDLVKKAREFFND